MCQGQTTSSTLRGGTAQAEDRGWRVSNAANELQPSLIPFLKPRASSEAHGSLQPVPIQPEIQYGETRAAEVQCSGPRGSRRRQSTTSNDCSEGAVLLSWLTWPCLKSNPFPGSHHNFKLHSMTERRVPCLLMRPPPKLTTLTPKEPRRWHFLT